MSNSSLMMVAVCNWNVGKSSHLVSVCVKRLTCRRYAPSHAGRHFQHSYNLLDWKSCIAVFRTCSMLLMMASRGACGFDGLMVAMRVLLFCGSWSRGTITSYPIIVTDWRRTWRGRRRTLQLSHRARKRENPVIIICTRDRSPPLVHSEWNIENRTLQFWTAVSKHMCRYY